MKFRYGFLLEYDGSIFSGWQWQRNSLTVQGALKEAAFNFCQEEITFYGAGRTDQGVHALGQVAHADFTKPWQPDAVRQGLNFYLKNIPISILKVFPVLPTFDARFSAVSRRYRYVILNRPSASVIHNGRVWWINKPLDVQAMTDAAEHLLGNHDFSSFRYRFCQSSSPIKTLDLLTVACIDNRIIISAKAKSFLHRQVRMMVGALVYVGKKKWPPLKMKQVLKDRSTSHGAATAPAEGLYLEQVEYPSGSSPFSNHCSSF